MDPSISVNDGRKGCFHCRGNHWIKFNCIQLLTRMHSSWMRTVRCSSRLLGGGGVYPGVSVQGGFCLQGVSAQDSVCLWGLPRGFTSPLTEFLTHNCENITFPQLRLRTVITEPIPITPIFYRQWNSI